MKKRRQPEYVCGPKAGERFVSLTRKVIAVSKTEIDKRNDEERKVKRKEPLR